VAPPLGLYLPKGIRIINKMEILLDVKERDTQ